MGIAIRIERLFSRYPISEEYGHYITTAMDTGQVKLDGSYTVVLYNEIQVWVDLDTSDSRFGYLRAVRGTDGRMHTVEDAEEIRPPKRVRKALREHITELHAARKRKTRSYTIPFNDY
jgi:hypothetical protein